MALQPQAHPTKLNSSLCASRTSFQAIPTGQRAMDAVSPLWVSILSPEALGAWWSRGKNAFSSHPDALYILTFCLSSLPLLVRLAIELSPLFRKTLPHSQRCDFTFWPQQDNYCDMINVHHGAVSQGVLAM